MAVVWQLQEEQDDVVVAVEASVHEWTMQNINELEEEHQLKPEVDLIAMDKTPKIPMLMPVVSPPPFPVHAKFYTYGWEQHDG